MNLSDFRFAILREDLWAMEKLALTRGLALGSFTTAEPYLDLVVPQP